MGNMASQITGVSIVYSMVGLGTDQNRYIPLIKAIKTENVFEDVIMFLVKPLYIISSQVVNGGAFLSHQLLSHQVKSFNTKNWLYVMINQCVSLHAERRTL